jgi:hypothetical protein
LCRAFVKPFKYGIENIQNLIAAKRFDKMILFGFVPQTKTEYERKKKGFIYSVKR